MSVTQTGYTLLRHAQCAFNHLVRHSRTAAPLASSSAVSRRLLSSSVTRAAITSSAAGRHIVLQNQAQLLRPLSSRMMSTEEQALSNYLQDEIDYEREMEQSLPEFENFSVSQEGTSVLLTRKFNDERVSVQFDINENNNIDESRELPEGEDEGVEEAANILSYPHFTVSIAKRSGKTLEFDCSYEIAYPEDEEAEDVATDQQTEEKQGFDIFKIDQVCVLAKGQTKQAASVYEAETTNMDGNLYNALMALLEERGVDGELADQLLDYSTGAEHNMHAQFLENLKTFVDSD